MKTTEIFQAHNLNLLKKIMEEENENMEVLRKTIKENGICLN